MEPKSKNSSSEIDIASANSYIMKGLENVMKQNSNMAISDFSQAIELNPQSEEAYSFRAAEYRKTYNWDKAIFDYSRAIDLKKSDSNYASRGCAYIMVEKYKEARNDLETALRINKDNDEAIQSLALLESIGY